MGLSKNTGPLVKKSELMPFCHNCAFDEIIEANRTYKEETLLVAVCPICHTFDWEIPIGADEDSSLFESSEDWAKNESEKLLKKHDKYYTIDFTEPAELTLKSKDVPIDEFKKLVTRVCDILGTKTVFITQFQRGIKLGVPEITVYSPKIQSGPINAMLDPNGTMGESPCVNGTKSIENKKGVK